MGAKAGYRFKDILSSGVNNTMKNKKNLFISQTLQELKLSVIVRLQVTEVYFHSS